MRNVAARQPGFVDRLKRMIGVSDAEAEAEAAPAGRPPAIDRDISDAGNPEKLAGDFIARLSRVLGERRSVLSGNINLVGLGAVREKLGVEWPRYAARAQNVADHCIRNAIGSEDIHFRYDELRFLIVFGTLNRDQAQARCLKIAEEIARRLLGEKFEESAAQVETCVVEADGTLVFSALTKEDLLQRLTGGDAAAREASGADAPESGGGEGGENGMPDFSFAKIDKAKALSLIRIVYRPVWSLKQKAITTYFAAPTAMNVFGRLLEDTELRHEYAKTVSSVEFDIFLARAALTGLANLVGKGHRVLLCWPVDFETIATRQSRETYLAQCREIPDAVRQLLVLEVDRLPRGAPQSRIVECVSALRPFCRSVFVRIQPELRRLAPVAGAGAGAVGFASPRQMDDAQCMRLMNEFAEQSAKLGLRSYVRGLIGRPQVLGAIAAGIDYIDGPIVYHEGDLPGPMRRFDIDEIYRDV
jgi:hypothetical protein